MVEKNGKIVEITEQELLDLYLKKEMDDIMSFQEYMFKFEEAGCVVEKMWNQIVDMHLQFNGKTIDL